MLTDNLRRMPRLSFMFGDAITEYVALKRAKKHISVQCSDDDIWG